MDGKSGLHLTRANTDRVNGWRNLKDLLYAGRHRVVLVAPLEAAEDGGGVGIDGRLVVGIGETC